MPEYNFNQRKKDVLSKLDKSYRQKWDEKARKVCEKLNKKEEYFTTSSCSGRVLLMIDQEKKGSGLFFWMSHNEITFEELKNELNKIRGKKLVKFKCEPPIIHIVSKNLSFGEKILEIGQNVGFKNSGIINLKRNVVVELHGTEKLEFPILDKGKILVNEDFLKLVVEKSNFKLKKGWELLKRLEKEI